MSKAGCILQDNSLYSPERQPPLVPTFALHATIKSLQKRARAAATTQAFL
jgi:hypothetical protein